MTLLMLFGLFAVLIVIEVPVAFAMGLASIATIALTQPIPLSIVVQRMGTGLDSFVLIAIPLFVLAGHLLNRAGIANRIFDFATALVGHIRGGLAHVNVVASMIFAGMSGVAQADAAGLGVVEVNAMRKEGFDVAFSAAVSAASAIIGPIIPPSVIMVVYAVMVQASVADLFLAGFLPGILMGGALMVMIYWLVRTGRVAAPPTQRMSYPLLGRTFVRALPALAAPILLTVGLLAGVATPTELGALTVVYAAALGFVQRELTIKDAIGAMRETLVTCGVLVFIIACAVPFGWIVATSQAPMKLAQFLTSISDNKYVILAIINIALLVIGCFMETTAILLIATPTLFPTVVALGIDPVHFGIMMTVNMEVGMCHPPVGLNLYVASGITKMGITELTVAVWPWLLTMLIFLVIVTYWPGLSTGLPRLLGMMG